MKITITFDSLEEFFATLKVPQAEGFINEPEAMPTQPMAAAEAKLEKLRKEAETEAAPEGFTHTESSPFQKEEPSAADVVDARRILAELNKKTGENTAKKLINALGFAKLSDVSADKLPELIAKAKEALNA